MFVAAMGFPSSFYMAPGDSLDQAMILFGKTETRVAGALGTEGQQQRDPRQLALLVRGSSRSGGKRAILNLVQQTGFMCQLSDRGTL